MPCPAHVDAIMDTYHPVARRGSPPQSLTLAHLQAVERGIQQRQLMRGVLCPARARGVGAQLACHLNHLRAVREQRAMSKARIGMIMLKKG